MSKKKTHLAFYIVLFCVVIGFLGYSKLGPKDLKLTENYFDTVCEITVHSRTKMPLKKCEAYLKRMDFELSANNGSSDISKLNSGEQITLSDDANELLEYGDKFTAENSEFFSIYLNSIIKSWDIKNNSGTIPDITTALDDVKNNNGGINLGGIAKGFVTDKIVEILKNNGISSALINLGGNTYSLGTKYTGENWKIGIQNPKDENKLVGIITAENLAVVTSGDYQRFFELDGVRYHHILDPKTGFPSNSGLHSVTVIGENATLCDALSTAIFVAGVDKGVELLKKYNVSGVLVTDDTVYFSKDIENIFKQTDFSYKYEFIY